MRVGVPVLIERVQEGVTAMELAEIILEYVKALAWPLTILLLVLKFRANIARILGALGDRLASAESVKVGLLGQEVVISGTAKELQAAGQELVAASHQDQGAKEKARRILQAIPQLNNPIADLVGITLLNARNGLTVDDLLGAVLDTLSPRKERDTLRGEQAQLLLMSMAREVEKVLAQLSELGFARVDGEGHSLTPTGREFFQKVVTRQQHLLSRFARGRAESAGA
jgi:hypothetical protein